MQVKGIAFIARRDGLIKKYGQETWDKFIAKVAQKIPYFSGSILSTTLIPLDDFLKLQDEIVREFYNGNINVFWEMGAQSAQFSLTEGPYKPYLASGNVADFVSTKLPLVFKAYYIDCGRFEAKVEGNKCIIKGLDLPAAHLYFEYTVVGYFRRAVELVGAKVLQLNKIKSITSGDKTFEYEAVLG
ncbi:MAG: hypothetical protein ACM3KR_08525 [Deltaproteobacteria bacterium]